MLAGINLGPARQISIRKAIHIHMSTMAMAQGARTPSPIIGKLAGSAPVKQAMELLNHTICGRLRKGRKLRTTAGDSIIGSAIGGV